MPGDIETFYLAWWYSPTTKLGLYFTGFSLRPKSGQPLSSLNNSGLDCDNGLAASMNEDYEFSNQITNNPVQGALATTDSIIPNPITVNIEGRITAIKKLIVASKLDFSQLGNATELLIQAWKQKQGLSLVTGLLYGKNYMRLDNMVIENLNIHRDNSAGRASLKFNLRLKQIQITSPTSSSSASFSNAQPYEGVILP